MTTAAAAVLIGQSAWTVTGFGSWHIQRYVEYVLPVLFVTAAVAVHGGVVTRGRLVGATLALAAALLLSPPVRQVLEERATFGLSLRADDLLGVATPVALTLATLVTGALAAVLLVRSGALARPGAALLIVAAITGAVLLVQDQAGWSWQIRLSQAFRAGYPHDLSWLDHSGPAPVARLLVTGSSPRWPVTEVFNRDVTAVYAPEGVPTSAVRGRSCQWTAQDSGALQFSGPCGTPPQRFYVDDDFGHMSFYGQHVDAGDPVVGEVVTVRGAPRLQSIVNVPCSRPTPHVDFGRRGRITAPLRICAASLDAHVWLDHPGVVLVRFRGDADTTHLATVGTQQYEIPPNTVTTIRIPEPAGSSGFTVTLDWSTPAPGLAAVDLLQAGHSTSLL